MFDSHAHVLFDSFDADRDEVIARARAAGLAGWLEVGTDVAGSQRAVEFVQEHEGAFATVGVHPSDISELKDADWQTIEDLLGQPKVVAVGEVGLDYYRGGTAEKQLPVLARFVELAVKHSLPVVFHTRDPVKESTDSHGARSAKESMDSHRAGGQASAQEDMINFLQSLSTDQRPRGVMHTFSGNHEQAEKYLALGMYLSFSGVVTFKNAGVIADVAKTAPADRFLIETDCPFLAPEPFRGKRNEPAYVRLVAEKIAELRGVAVEDIISQTVATTQTLFMI